jgi:diguanylate cyclase
MHAVVYEKQLTQEFMENRQGKGFHLPSESTSQDHRHWHRCISVIGALYPLTMPGWIWALLLFNAFAWPMWHISCRPAPNSLPGRTAQPAV